MNERAYCRYINLPRISEEVLSKINPDPDQYSSRSSSTPNYVWTDDFNFEVNQWCQANICDSIYWAFQMIRPPEMQIHKDRTTTHKFVYVLDTGGDHVETRYYDEHDPTKVVETLIIPPHQWCILRVDCYHSVHNIEPGRVRMAVTGRIFP